MSIDSFIKFCADVQPHRGEDITRFFEGVVFFPYDKELLLQSYLFLNVRQIFPSCSGLLLFESAVNGSSTHEGKCDFVFLNRQDSLLFVEIKYIDTEATGKTATKRRNAHRQQVLQQVKNLRDQFSQEYQIPVGKTECAVFTTDRILADRPDCTDIETKFISIAGLEHWRKEKKDEILKRLP